MPGCAEENGRQAVAGTVTYGGAPLADGTILFRPLGDGRTAGTKVEQGEFHIPRDKGLLPGNYRVEIKAMRAVGKTYINSESGQEEQDREQFIPARYNSQTELTRKVTEGGKNRLDFELTGNED